MAYAFFPAQMLTLLPFGWLFYTHGTLSIGTFLTVIIDPENEAVIQSALARLVRGKTLLVIAHRLSTIADADQIIYQNFHCLPPNLIFTICIFIIPSPTLARKRKKLLTDGPFKSV